MYNSINLNTLYHSRSKKYVLDEFDIRLVTNTKDLVTRKASKAPISQAALFGYPDYSQAAAATRKNYTPDPYLPADSVKQSIRGGSVEMLKGTEKEVTAIAGLLKKNKLKVTKYLQQQASEEALKKLHNPHILHIATHGFFLPEEADSKNEMTKMGMDNKKMAMNPLLRSGLLLAGAQQALDGKITSDSLENGILTAYEAMNLHLDNTDLVVLSACETGLGEIRNGEGVYGLQRAFQTAGARAVLMSLWKVDDKATQELMTLFYEQWLKTGNKREAFSEAQKVIREKYPEPYYWGAFVLVGE